MFQDSLLIIKPDYLAKRKAVLLYLLKQGFHIKGQRKTCFTPELAAEFYQDRANDGGFMFQVILLSKGNSEALIVAKKSGVEELINSMVCYFCSSTEMEQNVHVTKCLSKVQREISFIFPNYIHEPIYCPEQFKFCNNNPLVESTIVSLYDILTNPEKDPHKSWKEKLAESLILTNKTLPRISNQCCHSLRPNAQDNAQQTKITFLQDEKGNENTLGKALPFDLSEDGSSLNITTSSCVSCGGFDGETKVSQPTLRDIIKARTAPLNVTELFSSSTLHSAKEDVWEELNGEENESEIDFYEFVKGQVSRDDEAKKKEDEAYFKAETLSDEDIKDDGFKVEKDIPNSDEPFEATDSSAEEPMEAKAVFDLHEEETLSIEKIPTKSKESILSVAEESKPSNEEIISLPKAVVAAEETIQSEEEVLAPVAESLPA